MTDTTTPRVCLRHLWAACCEIWPDMPPVEHRGRVSADIRKRAAFCLAAKPFGHPLSRIGAYIKRDHTTVINAMRQAEEWRRRDMGYGLDITRIRLRATQIARDEMTAPDELTACADRQTDAQPAKPNEVFPTRFDMMMENGSRALLKALVTTQAHVFAETPEKSSSCPTKSLPSYYAAESQGSNLGA